MQALAQAHTALVTSSLSAACAVMANATAPTEPAPPRGPSVRNLRKRARRRAKREANLWNEALDQKLQRAAFGGLRRAVLRSDDDNPDDLKVAIYWVAAVRLVFPRWAPWPGRTSHMHCAHSAWWPEGDWTLVSASINNIARALWTEVSA
jgi:hypothetical protein